MADVNSRYFVLPFSQTIGGAVGFVVAVAVAVLIARMLPLPKALKV